MVAIFSRLLCATWALHSLTFPKLQCLLKLMWLFHMVVPLLPVCSGNLFLNLFLRHNMSYGQQYLQIEKYLQGIQPFRRSNTFLETSLEWPPLSWRPFSSGHFCSFYSHGYPGLFWRLSKLAKWPRLQNLEGILGLRWAVPGPASHPPSGSAVL